MSAFDSAYTYVANRLGEIKSRIIARFLNFVSKDDQIRQLVLAVVGERQSDKAAYKREQQR